MKACIIRVFSLFVAALFGAAMYSPAVSAAAQTLTYANFPPAPTFPCVQMERWKEEVEKKTAGKVVIKTFPGSTLLGAKNMFDGVVSGQADIGCFAMSYHPGRFPVVEAVDLPHGWPNATVASLALLDLYDKYKPKSFEKVKVLTMFTCPPANIMSIDPVRSIADLKGLEIRAAGTGVKVFELLGASPIGMPQSDVPDALHKKVIKGMASSLEVMKDFNYAEYCRYITMTNLQVVTFGVVMNLDVWNALPEDIRNVMDELIRDQTIWTGRYVDAHVDEAVAWSKKTYNVEVITFDSDNKQKMHELLSPLVENYISRVEPQVPGKKIIEDIAALMEKYAPQYQ
jgi:TRAP-type C4-dicarboxylate transport system substrate-binding protein